MTKTQINYFIAVAREQNFTRAANLLYISQPAISKSISALEDELGFALFERQNSTLTLTAAGSRMYNFFLRVSSELTSLLEDIRSTAGNSSALIRLGCPETWNPAAFYGRIASHFAQTHPSIRLSIESCRLSDLFIKLQTDKLDVVLTHDFYGSSVLGVSSEVLTSSGCGILYSEEHFSNVTSLFDFKDTDFLLFDSNIEKRFSGIIRGLCSEYGFVPKIKHGSQMAAALFDTACGKGVMLFSDWDSAVLNTSYGFLRLPVRIPIKIIYPAEPRSSLIKLFVDETIRQFSD